MAHTYYKIDTGGQQTYGNSAFDVSGDGDHTVSFWSVDGAGNTESANTVHVKIDTTAPTTTATYSNSYVPGSWTNQTVSVTLHPGDGTGSGVAHTYYTIDSGGTQTYNNAAFDVSGEGTHTITYWSVDNVGNTESPANTATIKIDLTKPSTTATYSNSYVPDTWTNQTVSVTLHPSDSGGSNVAHTYYTIDSGDTQTYANSSFDVSGEGTHTITFWSVDGAGNTETANTATIKIDLTNPTTTATYSNSYVPGDWTSQSVEVTLHPSDTGGSDVAHTYYTIDSGQQQTYGDAFTISDEGDHTVSFWSVDGAGNTESATSVHVKIDKSDPVITYTGNQGSYTVDQTVDITCTPSDAYSGVASSTCQDITGPAYSFGVGSHTFSATATDNVGHVGSNSVTFSVGVTVQSLSTLTARFETNPFMNMVLQSALRNVAQADSLHLTWLKTYEVQIYISLVNMQRGITLTSQQADTLIQLARQL